METIKSRDEILERLWSDLEDVPFNPETECIEENFLCFPAGTDRDEIWHWFDERHSKGVAHLLYEDGVDRTEDLATLAYRNTLCFECGADCVYNPEGVCRFALVTGIKADMDEDGCCMLEELSRYLHHTVEAWCEEYGVDDRTV